MIPIKKVIQFIFWGTITIYLILINFGIPAYSQSDFTASTPLIEPEEATDKTLLQLPPSQGKPVPVSVGIYLIDITDIDTTKETYKLGGYLTSQWQDKRLVFDPKDVGASLKFYNPDTLWNPKITLVNSQAGHQVLNKSVSVQPDGVVYYYERITATLSNDFNLKTFPFDSQNLKIIVESFDFDNSQVNLFLNQQTTGISQDSYLRLPDWQISDKNLSFAATVVPYKPEKTNYSRLIFKLDIQRRYGFYIWKIIFPLILINCISWGVFWLDTRYFFASQVTIGMTSMIIVIAFNFTINNNLPKIAYLTFLDGFLICSYLFVSASLFLSIRRQYLFFKLKQIQLENQIKERCKWLFPLSFVISNVILLTFIGSL